jgi:hypothetical protein
MVYIERESAGEPSDEKKPIGLQNKPFAHLFTLPLRPRSGIQAQ